jgi:hypothetical protein
MSEIAAEELDSQGIKPEATRPASLLVYFNRMKLISE